MRILLWHGYLLSGTGSNVYTRSLARAWSNQGHDVVVVCQERHPERYDLGTATVVRPELDGPLPVFVLDRYPNTAAQLLPAMAPRDRQRFVDRNVSVLLAQGPADLVVANHVLLGGPVAAATGLPYVVKAHGSELEYAMRGNPELCQWGHESLRDARAVIAGSTHVAGVLAELVAPDPDRVHVIPPGVDVDDLRPRDREAALAGLLAECARDEPGDTADPRRPVPGNARRLCDFFDEPDCPTVLYVGKLSPEKGVFLLVEALRRVDARAVVVGFGPDRATLEAAAGSRVIFTGPLEHRHLRYLWPLGDVTVVPSVFPEAFGMVAAEAAACGCPPLVARQSGLAEVAAGVEAEYPPALRGLAGFQPGDVDDLVDKLRLLLSLAAPERAALAAGARRAATRHWSWSEVAARVLAAGG